MPLSSFISEPGVFVSLLIAIGILLAFGILMLYRRQQKRMRITGADRPLEAGEAAPIKEDSPPKELAGPKFTTFQRRSGLAMDLLRAMVIVLSLIAAAAIVLVALPESTADRLVQYLESRHGSAGQEKIAFLYLGDQIADGNFRIRGAVRNITSLPVERLDAVVRFYAKDRSLLETVIVRMDKEIIDPNEIARFELVYPGGRLGFAAYSAEFKMRQGEVIPYKDLRKTRMQSN